MAAELGGLNTDKTMKKGQSGKNIIWTDREFRTSTLFKKLTKTSFIVLIEFYAKRRTDGRGKRAQMTNNGQLVFTYNEAETLGISRSSFQRSLDQLIEYGFIDVVTTGAGLYRSPNLYALSDRWKDWGKPNYRPAKRNPHGRNKRYGFQPQT